MKVRELSSVTPKSRALDENVKCGKLFREQGIIEFQELLWCTKPNKLGFGGI